MKRLIFIAGSTETLEYFSLQLCSFFIERGREVFLWDMKRPAGSREAFEALPDPGNSELITFNFLGLCGEGQFEYGFGNIWDHYGVSKFCIMVDSPIYYYRQLSTHMPRLRLACIDKYHLEFTERFYPEYGKVTFLPLAGNKPLNTLFKGVGLMSKGSIGDGGVGDGRIGSVGVGDGSVGSVGAGDGSVCNPVRYFDFAENDWFGRPFDAVFIGNYVTVQSLEPSLVNLGNDYKEYIYSLVDELVRNPKRAIEPVLVKSLAENFPDSSDEEYLQAMFQMVFIDLYVRTAYRGKIVTSLAEAGIKVYCTGKDWDKAPCKRPKNIIHTGESVVSLECLMALNQAKLSLNMMPWFKAGAHDRIFSSQLCGCAVLSDGSEYLDEIMQDGNQYAKYVLSSPEETAAMATERAVELLKHPADTFEMAKRGKAFAQAGQTWKDRGAVLEGVL